MNSLKRSHFVRKSVLMFPLLLLLLLFMVAPPPACAQEVESIGRLTVGGTGTFNDAVTIVGTAVTPVLQITQHGTGDILNVFDSSTEVLTVLDGGKVGIGTTAPGAGLQVGAGSTGHSLSAAGDVYVTGNLEVDGTTWLDGNVTYTSLESETLTISGTALLATTAGRVGIGTTTPSYRLHVPWLSGDTTYTAFFGSSNASNDQRAVYGRSYSSYGVVGISASSYGVYGISTSNYGVTGQSTSNAGVYGLSTTNRAGYFTRNNTAGTATQPVVDIIQDSATSETSTVLRIQGDGTGDLVNIFDTATEVFTILDGGNVGIGTTAPTSTLTVSGSGLIQSSTNITKALQVLSSQGTSVFNVDTTNGRVGIGTTTPDYKLTISHTSNTVLKLLTSVNSTASAGAVIYQINDDGAAMGTGHRMGGMYFGAAEDASHTLAIGAAITSNTDETWDSSGHGSRIQFETTPNNSTTRAERMRVDSNGNVGIGTTVPASGAKLHVAGSGVFDSKVGIGTTAPAKLLHVAGGDIRLDSTYDLQFGNANTGIDADAGTNIEMFTAAGVRVYLDTNTGSLNNFEIYSDVGIGTTTGAIFTVEGSGNVGIGNTVPATGLHIGTAASTHSLNTANDVIITGKLEVDGLTWLDGRLNVVGATGNNTDSALQFNEGAATRAQMKATFGYDQLIITTGTDTGTQLILTEFGNRDIDHDHTDQSNPTLFIQSAVNPTTDNTCWGSLTHTGTGGAKGNFDIQTGGGDIRLLPATGYITEVGDAGSTSHSLNTNDDLFVTGNLEVDGAAYFDGDLTLGDAVVDTITVNGTISASGTASFSDQLTVQGTALLATTAGRVGIGTTAPANRLHVPWLSGDAVTTAYFGSSNASNDQVALEAVSYSGNPAISIASTTGVAFYATSTTNLAGQYTINPATTNTLDEIIRLRRQTSGTAANGIGGYLRFLIENDAGVNEGAARIGALFTNAGTGSEASALTFWTRTGGATAIEQVRIDHSGNVGIGTTAPAASLHTIGTALFATTSGNVGIGITNPTHKLDITASSASTTFSTGNSAIFQFVNSDATASNMTGIAFSQAAGTVAGAGLAAIHRDRTGGARDSDLGFYTSNNSAVTQKMIITGTGNVGIGNTVPATGLHVGTAASTHSLTTANDVIITGKLEVDGETFLDGDINLGDIVTDTITINGTISASGTASFSDQLTVQGTALLATTAGRVGIGTTAPSNRLEVPWLSGDATTTAYFGSSNASNNQIAIDAVSYSSYGVRGTSTSSYGVRGDSTSSTGVFGVSTSGIGARGTSTTGRAGYFSRNNTAGTATTAVFEIIQDSATSETNTVLRIQGDGTGDLVNIFDGADEVVTVLDGGKVGIGITAPTATLEGSANSITAAFQITQSGTGNLANLKDGTTAVFTVADGGALTIKTTTDSTTGIQVLDADGGTPILNIDTTNERVGIGTTAPGYTLDVNGIARFGTAATGSLQIKPFITGHAFNELLAGANEGLRFTTGATTIITLLPNGGNVGIGTTAPSQKLHVAGSGEFDNNVIVSGEATVGGGYGSTGATISTAGVIQANGAITTDGALTADSTTIGGGYGSTGVTISNAGAIQANDALTVDGASTLTGTATLSKALYVTGYSVIGAWSTTHSLGSAGDLKVTGKLEVDGETFLDGDINLGDIVTDTITINGTISASGTASFSDQLTVQGTALLATTAGRVGIGTTVPANKLTVVDTSSDAVPVVSIQSTTAGGSMLSLVGETGDKVFNFDSDGTGGEARLDMSKDGVITTVIHSDGNTYFNGGNVGIGTTAPATQLDVTGSGAFSGNVDITKHLAVGTNGIVSTMTLIDADETYTIQTGSVFGQRIDVDLSPAGALSGTTLLYGQQMTAVWDSAEDGETTDARLYGYRVVCSSKDAGATGDVNRLEGSYSQAIHYGTGTAANLVGLHGYVANSDAYDERGNVTNAYSILADAYTDKTTGTITNLYGLRVNDATGAGNLTNQYGIFIEDINAAGTTNYALYSTGGTNYFGGDVGIANTVPATGLHIGTAASTHSLTSANDVIITGKLEVDGETFLDGDINLGDIVTDTITINGTISASGTASFSDQLTVQGTALLATTAGRVGIGTTTPDSELDIEGTSTPTLTLQSTDASDPTMIFKTSNTARQVNIYLDENQAGDELHIVGQTAGVEMELSVTGQTNVLTSLLIASGTEAGRLSLFGNTDILELRNYISDGDVQFKVNDGGSNVTPLYIDSSISQVQMLSTAATITPLMVKGFASQSANLQEWQNSTGTPLAVVDSAGNVGIGTTAPASGAKLHIAGTGIFDGKVGIGTTAPAEKLTISSGNIQLTQGNYIYLDDSNPTDAYLRASASKDVTLYAGDDLTIQTAVGASKQLTLQGGVVSIKSDTTSAIYINNSALVGIGTTAPVSTLSVSGSGLIQSSTNITKALQVLSSQGTSVFQVDTTNGRVGIGTTAPSVSLETTGAIKIGANQFVSTPSGYLRLTSGSGDVYMDGNLGIGTTAPAGKLHTTGTALFATTTGNVGIGTTAPEDKLHIFEGDSGLATFNSNSVLNIENNGWAAITIATPNNATGLLMFADPEDSYEAGIEYNHSDNKMTFQVNDADKMVIDSGGNVGIATTAPTSTLSVSGSGLIQSSTNITKALQVLSSQGTSVFNVDTTNGRVGIGTTAPDYTLDVAGSAGFDEYIYHNGDEDTFLRLLGDRIIVRTGNEAFIDILEDDSQDYVKLGDGGDVDINLNDDVFIEASTGNVGVGTTTPATATILDVAGTASISGHTVLNTVNYTWPPANGDNGQQLTTNSAGVLSWADAGSAAATGWTDDGDVVRLDTAADQVGIGTTAPAAGSNLHVAGTGIFDGKIGIGTTTPQAVFEVSRTAGPRIQLDALGSNNGGVRIVASTATNSPAIALLLQGVDATPYAELYCGDQSAWRTLALQPSGGNVGIGTTAPAAGSNLHVAGTAIFATNAGSKVGIGTTVPSDTLEINGGLTFTGAQTITNTTGVLTIDPVSYSRIGNLGTPGAATGADDLLVTNILEVDGYAYHDSYTYLKDKVYFGTTTTDMGDINAYYGTKSGDPLAFKLDVDSSGSAGIQNPLFDIFADTDLANLDTSDDIKVNIGNASVGSTVNITGSGTNATLDLTQYGTGDILNVFDGATEVFTIEDGGQVGIGTTVPAYRLEVPWLSGDAVATAYFGSSNASNNQTAVYGQSYSGYGVHGASPGGYGIYGTSTNNVAIYGISTNSIGIFGNSLNHTAGYFYRNNTAGTATTAVLDIIQDSATAETNTVLRVQGDGAGDLVNVFDGATEVLTIEDGGEVGIGTTAPGAKLDVIGSGRFIADAATVVGLTVQGTASQSGNLLELQNSAGNIDFALNSSGEPLTDRWLHDSTNMFWGTGAGGSGNISTAGGGGHDNMAVGNIALQDITSGYDNMAFGPSACKNITSGYSNVGIGVEALNFATTVNRNVAIGQRAMYGAKTDAHLNVAIGVSALSGTWSGQYNVAIGPSAMYGAANQNPSYSTAIGADAFEDITSGNNNVGIGYAAGRLSTTGDGNVYLGHKAGYRQTTASNLLIIDNQDRGSVTKEGTASLIYGVFAADAVDQILTFNADVGIGTTAPQDHLHIISTATDDPGTLILNNLTTTTAPSLLGEVWFGSDEGSGWKASGIKGVAVDDFNDTDFPSELQFLTTADNTGTPVEHMTITKDGVVEVIDDSFTNNNCTGRGDLYVADALEVDGTTYGTFSDLAENYDIVLADGLESGDVAIIDEDGSMKLRKAITGYDTKVAGIISSQPSYVLNSDQEGLPLALAGKVPCKVDASYGEIKPGDLLTSSPTPGHAMVVTDRMQAIGAIIGKALEGKTEGRGKIEVLLTLQ